MNSTLTFQRAINQGSTPPLTLLGGFVIGAWVSLLRQHSPNAKCQRVLVLALYLVYSFLQLLKNILTKVRRTIPGLWVRSSTDKRRHHMNRWT